VAPDASPVLRMTPPRPSQENPVIEALIAANSRPFKNPSPVTELAHGSVLTVGQLSESLLRYMGRHGGWSREPGNLLLDMLLGGGADRKLPKTQACGLNSNGMPVQLCVSARRGSTAMVLIGDPWADMEDPRVRQRESVVCAWRLLAHTGCEALRIALQATLTTVLPSSAAEADTVLRGVLWLGAGVRKPSFSLYACPTWDGNMQTGWLRVERWLNEVLSDPASALCVVEQIRPIASPECACIEGTPSGSGRAKVYFRLLRAVAPNALRLLGLDNAGVDTFLQTAVESRALRLQAMVFGVSFCLNTGTFVDASRGWWILVGTLLLVTLSQPR
jgi:hypothetical protein